MILYIYKSLYKPPHIYSSVISSYPIALPLTLKLCQQACQLILNVTLNLLICHSYGKQVYTTTVRVWKVVNSTLRCHSHSHSLDTKEWAGSADECEVRGLAQARSEQQEEFIAWTTGWEEKRETSKSKVKVGATKNRRSVYSCKNTSFGANILVTIQSALVLCSLKKVASWLASPDRYLNKHLFLVVLLLGLFQACHQAYDVHVHVRCCGVAF
jgi:hypothetical protein